MFILWGFGHQSVKHYGNINPEICGNCNNHTSRQMLKITTWFTLFFIPIIPYRKQYSLICPICKSAHQLGKEGFNEMVERERNAAYQGQPMQNFNQVSNPSPRGELSEEQKAQQKMYEEKMKEIQEKNKYAGKTETQIAYLKQMEEFEKNRAERE